MSRFYKNILRYGTTQTPDERIKEISNNISKYADFLPKTLSYEDIDRAFKDWVDGQIVVIQDGIKLPTMSLFSNQRFSEYMQTWKYTDENNNVRLNFKTVTRENNPQRGSIIGDYYCVPNNKYYTIKSIQAIDENGKKYRLDYKMRQPATVDLIYKVSILTNKYTSINEMNEEIHRLFRSKQCYIAPNGHFMSMILENATDESEYNIEDRQFFSQSFHIKVRGYIIKENDFIVEENPIASIICFEGDTAKRRKPTIDLFEYDPCYVEEEKYYKKPLEIDIDLSYCSPCNGKIKFTMDEDFILTKLDFKEPLNIEEDNILLFINDEQISSNLLQDAFEGYEKCEKQPNDISDDNIAYYDKLPTKRDLIYKYISINDEIYQWHQIRFREGDEIAIKTKRVRRHLKTGGLILTGYNKFEAYSVDSNEQINDTKVINVLPMDECCK